MKRLAALIMLAWVAFALTACKTHLDLQYSPQRYAKLRNVQILTSTPSRAYHVVAKVEGSGGRFTAKETMINAMIDSAHKEGGDALIPLEFEREGRIGLDLFVYRENGRTVTKGQVIKWGEAPQ